MVCDDFPGRLRFWWLTLSVARRELLANGAPVRLGARAFDLLLALVRRSGSMATKDELLAEVWPGTVVQENNLQVQISSLRKVLGEETEGARYLLTVPGRGYRFVAPVERLSEASESTASPLPSSLPDKPSIAVLPFTNMTGDPDQDYFSDGVVEDIISALSRIQWLFVTARNSSFIYKGKAVDIKHVGRQLGVLYVLQGSLRKSANQVRITTQLIDATRGVHLYANRFEGVLDEIFHLQDEVARSVVGVIAPKLEQAEIDRAKRKPTESLDAYDYYLRGLAQIHQLTRDSNSEALRMLEEAIETDPTFALALAMASLCYQQQKAHGWTMHEQHEAAEAVRLAGRAAEHAKEEAGALCWSGYVMAYFSHDLTGGLHLIDRALALNPNLAAGWYCSGWVRARLGDTDRALLHLDQALRLNPLDPAAYRILGARAIAHFIAGRYNDASLSAEEALRERPNYPIAIRIYAASNALAGRQGALRQETYIYRQF